MTTKGRKPSGPKASNKSTSLRSLAHRVVDLRAKSGISQQELSQKCGLGRHGIHRIEKAIVDPKLSTLEAVAQALDTTVPELLGAEVIAQVVQR